MSAIQLPYLGKPLAMVALPSPNSPVTATPTRGDTKFNLASGGTAMFGRLNAKLSYSLPYMYLDSASADILMDFYLRGSCGTGPFVFVDPSRRNVLGFDVSTCGVRSQASPGWIQSSGTLTVDTATTPPPTQVPKSGVLKLAGASASATLQPGLAANVANILTAPVYLPTEAASISLWIKASAAATLSLQMTGYTAAGVVAVTSVASSVSATTSWQQFSVSVNAANGALAAAAFILPRVVLGGTPPASLYIAGAQLEYATAPTAWQMGFGSPRVLPSATPGREIQQTIDFPTNHTFVLDES